MLFLIACLYSHGVADVGSDASALLLPALSQEQIELSRAARYQARMHSSK